MQSLAPPLKLRNTESLDGRRCVHHQLCLLLYSKALQQVVGALLCAERCVLIWQLLDDAVYVPEDAEKRYGLPVVATLPRKGETEETVPALLKEEAERCFRSFADAGKKWVLLNETTSEAERGAADVLLLEVPYGKRNGTLTAHILAQARARGEEVRGIVMTDADMLFLKRYYRL